MIKIRPEILFALSDQHSKNNQPSYGLIYGSKDQENKTYNFHRSIELPNFQTQSSSIIRQQLYNEMFNLKIIKKPENPFDNMEPDRYDKWEKEHENDDFEVFDSNLVEFNNGLMNDGHEVLGFYCVERSAASNNSNNSSSIEDLKRKFESLLNISKNENFSCKNTYFFMVFKPDNLNQPANANDADENLPIDIYQSGPDPKKLDPTQIKINITKNDSTIISDVSINTENCLVADIEKILNHASESTVKDNKKKRILEMSKVLEDGGDEGDELDKRDEPDDARNQDLKSSILKADSNIKEKDFQKCKENALLASVIGLLSDNNKECIELIQRMGKADGMAMGNCF